MSSIPLFYCQINTDNAVLIGKILEKKDFIQQSLSPTFMKSNFDHNIQIDLSQSFASPSIICCCSTISTTFDSVHILRDQWGGKKSVEIIISSSEEILKSLCLIMW